MAAAQKLCIGWLDLGEEEQRRAGDYLAQFKADNTLDELGVGIIRDAFADVFFPGTNTIMTRTRYIIFIPALCLLVEKEKVSGNAAGQRLNYYENRLREALSREESLGVIGDLKKERLQRYPSSIYWNAIRRLGIFVRANWGLAYYLDHLSDFYSATTPEKDDDGLSHLSISGLRNWEPGLPEALAAGPLFSGTGRNFPESLNFSLPKSEAHYLRSKYMDLERAAGRPSIISHLMKRHCRVEFGYPWDAEAPDQLTVHVEHARLFSMFTQGATLQYWHLLQSEREARGIAPPECDFQAIFDLWWKATHRDLASWKLDEFFELATSLGAIRRENDKAFLRAWLKLNLDSSSPGGMLEDSEAHDLIRRREKVTRPRKSRLHHTEYLQRWNSPDQASIDSMAQNPNRLRFGLDYRAWIGSVFVRDVLQGLEN